MAAPKIVEALRPYIPEPVPYSADQLIRFLDQELMRIAETIQPLADTFNPEISGAMANPALPLQIATVRTKITDYEHELHSESFSYEQIFFDRLNGEIDFNGNEEDTLLIKITANIIITRGNLKQNQSFLLEVGSDNVGYTTIAQAYLSEVQQDAISLSGSRYLEVPGNAQIALYVTAFENNGSAADIQGDYEIEFIDNHSEHSSYRT